MASRIACSQHQATKNKTSRILYLGLTEWSALILKKKKSFSLIASAEVKYLTLLLVISHLKSASICHWYSGSLLDDVASRYYCKSYLKLVGTEVAGAIWQIEICRYVLFKSILMLESSKQKARYVLKDKLVLFRLPKQTWFRIGAKSGFCVSNLIEDSQFWHTPKRKRGHIFCLV